VRPLLVCVEGGVELCVPLSPGGEREGGGRGGDGAEQGRAGQSRAEQSTAQHIRAHQRGSLVAVSP
jgi:hypothetical protein